LGHELRLMAHIANHFMQFADFSPARGRRRNSFLQEASPDARSAQTLPWAFSGLFSAHQGAKCDFTPPAAGRGGWRNSTSTFSTLSWSTPPS
jgi:hypothetical protein